MNHLIINSNKNISIPIFRSFPALIPSRLLCRSWRLKMNERNQIEIEVPKKHKTLKHDAALYCETTNKISRPFCMQYTTTFCEEMGWALNPQNHSFFFFMFTQNVHRFLVLYFKFPSLTVDIQDTQAVLWLTFIDSTSLVHWFSFWTFCYKPIFTADV